MTEAEAREVARRERDQYIGHLLRQAAKEAQKVHRELGLPDDVLLVFNESGMTTRRICKATSEAWPGRYCELDAGHEGVHKSDLGVLTVTLTDTDAVVDRG